MTPVDEADADSRPTQERDEEPVMKMIAYEAVVTTWDSPDSKDDREAKCVGSTRVSDVVPFGQDGLRVAAIAQWLLDQSKDNAFDLKKALEKMKRNLIKVTIMSEKEIDAPHVR